MYMYVEGQIKYVYVVVCVGVFALLYSQVTPSLTDKWSLTLLIHFG